MRDFHIQPQRENDFDEGIAWRVMSLDTVDAELKRLERALGGATKLRPKDVDLSDEGWYALMERVLVALENTESGVDPLDLSEKENMALRSRIGQARKALKYARRLQGHQVDPTTTVLLPEQFAPRFEMLIGHGELPIAWIVSLDVSKF